MFVPRPDQEFVADSNLALPRQVTEEELDLPVSTTTLRLAPVVWSGVPYMAVKLFYCAKDEDVKPEQVEATGTIVGVQRTGFDGEKMCAHECTQRVHSM